MRHIAVFLLLIPLLFAGCNIFSWTHSNSESHVDKGLELMREGRYTEAETEFARAIEDDPHNADARYYHAKAIVGAATFDALDLVRKISQIEGEREQQGAPLPLFNEEAEVADEIYGVNLTIIDDLMPIYEDQAHGSITSEDIEVDLALAYLITVVLGLRDTNQDSSINDDDILLDITFSLELGEYSVRGLEQFLGGGAMSHSLDMSSPAISPDDINPLIDFVLYLIDTSEDIIVAVIQDMTEGLSTEAIRALLDDVRTTIVKYYYNDNKDNDGDGFVDEETLNGLDDDNDGYYDEDTDHV